jgi:hypothetical protein
MLEPPGTLPEVREMEGAVGRKVNRAQAGSKQASSCVPGEGKGRPAAAR